jgi:hypothetical protein
MKYTNHESLLADLTDAEANRVQGGLDFDFKGFSEDLFNEIKKRLEPLSDQLADRLGKLPQVTIDIQGFFDRH